MMGDRILPILRNRPEESVSNLTSNTSYPELRTAITSFYTDCLHFPNVDPANFVFGCGISYLIERLGLILCAPGEVALIPRPCYGCFEPDLLPSGAAIVFIDLKNLPPSPPPHARLLLLTDPGNPYGRRVQNAETILEWAYQAPDLHIVVDDVYAMSNRRGETFYSIPGRTYARPDRVHQLYGISKDWGMAGPHLGFFYTRNQDLLKLMLLASRTYRLSSDTATAIARLIGDKPARDEYLRLYRERLITNAKMTIDTLTAAGISVTDCENSLFFVIDLRDIAGRDNEQELEIWKKLLYDYEVHVLPGAAGFRIPEPGFFRLCYTAPVSELTVGLERLVTGVRELRSVAKNH
jgi:aspartate/methionine/tyrosine aminotransferase